MKPSLHPVPRGILQAEPIPTLSLTHHMTRTRRCLAVLTSVTSGVWVPPKLTKDCAYGRLGEERGEIGGDMEST